MAIIIIPPGYAKGCVYGCNFCLICDYVVSVFITQVDIMNFRFSVYYSLPFSTEGLIENRTKCNFCLRIFNNKYLTDWYFTLGLKEYVYQRNNFINKLISLVLISLLSGEIKSMV